MAKYTITDDQKYILFDGILGTPTAGERFAFRKQCIKQVRTAVTTDAIHLIHLDDMDSPFMYYDLVDPSTGHEFASLSACKDTFLLLLNNDTSALI